MFTPDFASQEASIPLYDKGRYCVKVTGKTPFAGEKTDDKGNVTKNGGVRYKLEMVGIYKTENGKTTLVTEDYQGRTVSPFRAYLHNEGSWKMTKPFLMAALGFTLKQEKEANEVFQKTKEDYVFDGEKDTPEENFTVGKGYDLPVGKLLDVTMEIKKDKKPGTSDEYYENQNFQNWAPAQG